jgi:hypothetical protein
MARQAQGTVEIAISLTEIDTQAGIAAGSSNLMHVASKARQMSTGTANGEIDRVWSTAAGSVGTGGASIDLVGSLTSQIAGGATTSFADVQYIYLENTATSGNLLVGGASNLIGILSGATDKIVIPPGGALLLDLGTAGLATTAGTADLIPVAASAGTVTYKALIAGRSA